MTSFPRDKKEESFIEDDFRWKFMEPSTAFEHLGKTFINFKGCDAQKGKIAGKRHTCLQAVFGSEIIGAIHQQNLYVI